MATAKITPPPTTTPLLDRDGRITTAWALYFQAINDAINDVIRASSNP